MADSKLDTLIRREQIAGAALELIANEGVRRLSIAAVARRVGLVPSGIYRHFKSKDEVLDAVLDLMESKMRANVAAAEGESDQPIPRLRSLMWHHIRFIREGRAFPRIIFSDDVFSEHPERKAQIRRILTDYRAAIEGFVHDGQQDGSIRPDLVPATVAMMFLGMIIPAAIVWHLTDGGFDVTQHATRAWQMFEQTIATNKNNGRK